MNPSLFCHVRQCLVARLPEEEVRQALIQKMVNELGYPLELIAVEKKLSQLPHLSSTPSLPSRRADILVFAKDIHPDHMIYPFLLIECKAVKMTPQTFMQLTGYNHYVRAFFIAAANQEKIFTGFFDSTKKDFSFYEGLPLYSDLIAQTKLRGDYEQRKSD